MKKAIALILTQAMSLSRRWERGRGRGPTPPGGRRAGRAAGAGLTPDGGCRGGRRHEGLGVLLSVSPYAGVRPRGETL